MSEPVWIDKALLLGLYEDVVAASGGATETMLKVARNEVSIADLARWLRRNTE